MQTTFQIGQRYIPRPYQAGAIKAGREFLLGKLQGGGLIKLPTGSGKSLVIAEIVLGLDGPALVFQPSKEILEQNLEKFQAYGYRPAVFSASAGEKQVGRITLATIGSAINSPELFRDVRYILIDECHLVGAKNTDSMFMRFLAGVPRARLLGLTATPYRLSTDGYGGSILKFLTRTRPRVFHHLVYYVQIGDLFRQGYLAKLEYKQVESGFREDRLRLNSTGADYTDESVRQHFKELHFSDQIVRCVNRCLDLGRRGVLVFTRFVEEAEYVASKIPGARMVSAETPKREREDILEGFRSGRIPAVANCGVLVVGFDYPELQNVILAQPTLSLARYYQMVGRAIRPHPDKESAYVIDLVGLVKRFGRVEDLVLDCGPHDTWFIRSGQRQLTNVYYGEPGQARTSGGSIFKQSQLNLQRLETRR